MAFWIIAACTGCTACLKVCPTQAISGSRKQLHVIDPAVCIECGACGLICPASAVLQANGEKCTFRKRSQWPKPVVLEDQCVSCNACLQACPLNVLAMQIPMTSIAPPQMALRQREARGEGVLAANPPHFIPYLRDAQNCIGCAFCEQTCPVRAIRMGAPESADA